MQAYNSERKVSEMTVGELDGFIKHSLLRVVKWWLLLTLGLPVAAFCALGLFYFVVSRVNS